MTHSFEPLLKFIRGYGSQLATAREIRGFKRPFLNSRKNLWARGGFIIKDPPRAHHSADKFELVINGG